MDCTIVSKGDESAVGSDGGGVVDIAVGFGVGSSVETCCWQCNNICNLPTVATL